MVRATPESWKEKRDKVCDYEVKITEKKFADIPEGASMLIATPKIVDEYIKQIPFGNAKVIKTMRKDLAAEYHAEYTCPVTSGIFVRIAAEAANEELQEGKTLEDITPFWRIISPKDKAASKLTFGKELLIEMREKESIS